MACLIVFFFYIYIFLFLFLSDFLFTPTAQPPQVVTVNDIVVSDVDGGNVTVSVAVSNGTVTIRNTTNIVSFTTGDGVDDATVVFTVDTTSTSSTHDFDLVYTAK